MRRIGFVLILAVLALALVIPAMAQQETRYAVGVVFDDTNRNGLCDQGEKGLKDVRVSNGRSITMTDEKGSYRLPINDDTIIFVIKPSGWMVPVNADKQPLFFYIHKPKGSPKLKYQGVSPTGPLPLSVDFPLHRQNEPDRFTALFFGDSQPTSTYDVRNLAHDVVDELIGSDAFFGVTLGDIVGDHLELYPTLVPVMGKIGVPWYYVKGNHDTNYDGAPGQDLTDETFERTFGPSYYSFDYGQVHFIAINNPYFENARGYRAELSLKQMAFLRNDLAMVPNDQLVALMMHIPIIEMKDRKEIYKLLETRPNTFSISAHVHMQEHFFLDKEDGWNGPEPHHHLVNVTTCGSWWLGAVDELLIPHTTMRDGAPNGYSIITFDKNKYSIRFKAARRPADHQMSIFVNTADAEKVEVTANVFAGSERSKVEIQMDGIGPWTPMAKTEDKDPYYVMMKKNEKGLKSQQGGLPDAQTTSHLWRISLPKKNVLGTHLFQVRTTDMFGQTYTGNSVITVTK
ncbi:MAG: calcineurin-like phosphoesterase family protein [Armatimonadota bacterium]|nr:calcineurin-like phosphoesterase family protein [Armatimonadota bacterium]